MRTRPCRRFAHNPHDARAGRYVKHLLGRQGASYQFQRQSLPYSMRMFTEHVTILFFEEKNVISQVEVPPTNYHNPFCT